MLRSWLVINPPFSVYLLLSRFCEAKNTVSLSQDREWFKSVDILAEEEVNISFDTKVGLPCKLGFGSNLFFVYA